MKLHVLRAGLRLRRDRPRTFLEGDYAAIDAGEEIVAFARSHAEGSVVCAVTRLPYRVTGGRAPFAVGDAWGTRQVAIPRREWRNVLTDTRLTVDGDGVAASKLFEELPVALLVSV